MMAAAIRRDSLSSRVTSARPFRVSWLTVRSSSHRLVMVTLSASKLMFS